MSTPNGVVTGQPTTDARQGVITYAPPPQPMVWQQPYVNQGIANNAAAMGLPPPSEMSLSILSTVNQLFIKQRMELLEIIANFETNNQYDIFNEQGGYLFHAQEFTDPYTRQMWGSIRPFNIAIRDLYGREIIRIQRMQVAMTGGFICCPESFKQPDVYVSSPPGRIIGAIEPSGGWGGEFYVKAPTNPQSCMMIIQGPGLFQYSYGTDVQYQIYTPDRMALIGYIVKKWSGIFQEAISDADNFHIVFPPNSSVEVKATLIGACLMIDFMYYESHPRDRHRHRY